MTALSSVSGFGSGGFNHLGPLQGSEALHLQFVQSQSALFRRLHVSQTLFLRIIEGSKEIRRDSSDVVVASPGWFVCLRRGEDLTVLNLTGVSGQFRADALCIPEGIIAGRPQFVEQTAVCSARGAKMSPEFAAAFDFCLNAATASVVPPRVFHHRLKELCIWAEEIGIDICGQQDRSLTTRLRTLIEANPDQSWNALAAAHRLGMSEATMRRRLSREGTRFSALLQDVRASFALMRIQTSRDSLAMIAYQSGFSSQARLNEAFRRRFDISPGSLRL